MPRYGCIRTRSRPDVHLKIFFERLGDQAFEALDSYEVNVYGAPSDAALGLLGQMPGLRVRVLPVHDVGFLRPQPLWSPPTYRLDMTAERTSRPRPPDGTCY